MKQIALTIEQMKHLEELGLDTSDASMYYMINYPFESDIPMFLTKDCEKIPNSWLQLTYTLQDILNKIPYKIHYENGDFNCNYTRVITDKCICYDDIEMYPDSEPLKGFYYDSKDENPYNSGNMINAFYDMLCWCIENKYVNI